MAWQLQGTETSGVLTTGTVPFEIVNGVRLDLLSILTNVVSIEEETFAVVEVKIQTSTVCVVPVTIDVSKQSIAIMHCFESSVILYSEIMLALEVCIVDKQYLAQKAHNEISIILILTTSFNAFRDKINSHFTSV